MRSQGRFSPRFTRRACLRAVRFSLGVIRQPAGFDPVSREYDTADVTDSPSIKKKNIIFILIIMKRKIIFFIVLFKGTTYFE
jgi:hypothetical protein